MKKASVALLRSQLSAMLDYVGKGREIEIQKRNVTIAKIIPCNAPHQKNKTKLGCGKGSVKFIGDILEPITEENWEMLK